MEKSSVALVGHTQVFYGYIKFLWQNKSVVKRFSSRFVKKVA
jgi:hypothetical protein